MWFGVREPLPPGITQGLSTFIDHNVPASQLTQESWNAAWERLMGPSRG